MPFFSTVVPAVPYLRYPDTTVGLVVYGQGGDDTLVGMVDDSGGRRGIKASEPPQRRRRPGLGA